MSNRPPVLTIKRGRPRILLAALISAPTLLLLAGCSQNLSAPSELGHGWTTPVAWAATQSSPQATKNAAAQRAQFDVDQKQLSTDFGGAQSLVEWYQFNSLQRNVELRAVRAQAPGYFVPAVESDAVSFGVSLPPHEVQSFGPVSCDVVHTAIAGTSEVAENTVVECMRTSKDLTVWVGPLRGLPNTVVDLVNDGWKQLGGSSGEPVPWPMSAQADTPVTLPSTIGSEYRPLAKILLPRSSAERFSSYAVTDSSALQALFNAPAAAAAYVDPTYENGFQIYAVRTDVPPSYVQYVDLKRLGYLAPIDEKVTIGGVQCLVENNLVQPGGDKTKLMPAVQWCERSDKGLTVRISYVRGSLKLDPTSVAQMVDTVWGAITA